MDNLGKKLTGFYTVIAIITAVMYLAAYWTKFGIDIFEFIDISNVVVYSIPPMLLVVGLILALITQLVVRRAVIGSKLYENVITDDSYKKDYRFLKPVGIVLMIMLVISIVAAYWYIRLWLIIPIIFSFLIVGYFSGVLEIGKQFLPDRGIRNILFFIAVLLPLEGMAFGIFKAEAIIRGIDFLYVDNSSISNELIKNSHEDVRYIGVMSGYFFFYLPNEESIYIASKDELKPFVLQRYSK